MLDPRTVLALAILIAAAVVLNLPLGYLRARQNKYSFRWFLYIHLAIPLIIALRLFEHLGYWAAPFLVVAALCGQIAGGRYSLSRAK